MRSGKRVRCLKDIGQIFCKDKKYKIHTLDFPFIILIDEFGNGVGFDMNAKEFSTHFIILPSNKRRHENTRKEI
jgi:hypothetical protein